MMVFGAALSAAPSEVLAANVTLAWNPNTESNLSGYKIHYGLGSRSYSTAVDVGKNVSYTMTGLQEGQKYYFAVTAHTTTGLSSGYSNEVSYAIPTAGGTSPPPAGTGEIVIDNGKSGTSATGTWTVSSAAGGYGGQSLYSKSTSALYRFSASVSNYQQVYLWWASYSNRSTKVPVKIYNGNTLIATVYVDQTKNGGKWNLLGSYTFSGSARVEIVSTSSTLTTCADAVRFVAAAQPTSVPAPVATIDQVDELIIDNGDPEASAAGTWLTSSTTDSFEGSSRYSKTVSSTFAFDADVSGQQDVYLWWAASSGRSTSVPVKIYDGGSLVDTVYVNQTQNGGKWNLLGNYSFSGSARVVITSTSSTLTTCADAVRFVLNEAPEIIIDNADPETTKVGTWLKSSAAGGFEGSSVYSQTTSSTFTFNADVSGRQDVYLWWTMYSNRSTKVPVKIYNGSTLIATVYVDQTKNGGKWNLLGNYSFSGSARVVITSTSSTMTTCADAAMFK
jgi:hypothetical protein